MPTAPIQTPEVKPSNVKSSLLIIMAICLLIATGLAGLFYFQIQPSPTPTATPDPTANWKRYPYDTFLIKLPLEWHTTQLNNPIQFLNYTPPIVGGDFNPLTDKGKLKIEIYKNSSLVSLREYVDSQKTGPLELGPYSEIPIKIDGIEAIKVTASNHGFSYYFKSGNFIYSLVFGLDFNNYTDLADQILSTFKFTD